MDFFQSAILGIIQGLTEFIPVSSSGHLSIFPQIFGWKTQGTVFDAFVNIGTLLALLIFYRVLIFKYTNSFFKLVFRKDKNKKDKSNLLVIRNILISTLPALVIGLLSEKLIKNFYDSPENKDISTFLTLSAMVIVGIIFIISPKLFKGKKFEIEDLSSKKSFIIGISQAFAFIRGVSRSGITLITAQFMGLKRVAAAEYVFLMSIPIMSIVSIYSIYELVKLPQSDFNIQFPQALVGMIFAFFSGIFAIKFLIYYLKNNNLVSFGIYRVCFAILSFIIIFGFR